MILGFKQTFPSGRPTKFREKILCHVLPEIYSLHYKPKIHSIREGDRWKEGMMIHMAYGVRTNKYEQFNKDYDQLKICTGVQRIMIHRGGDLVMIDGKGLNFYTKQMLAENDGFETYEHFQKWFKNGILGQIIHWTDYRY